MDSSRSFGLTSGLTLRGFRNTPDSHPSGTNHWHGRCLSRPVSVSHLPKQPCIELLATLSRCSDSRTATVSRWIGTINYPDLAGISSWLGTTSTRYCTLGQNVKTQKADSVVGKSAFSGFTPVGRITQPLRKVNLWFWLRFSHEMMLRKWKMVWIVRFELTATCFQGKRSTKLSYIQIKLASHEGIEPSSRQ